MLDTVGPELQVVNTSETPISLQENGTVVLTPHQGQQATDSLLPINFSGLAKVTHCTTPVSADYSVVRSCVLLYVYATTSRAPWLVAALQVFCVLPL
jgi:hypothetical protein